MTDLLGYLGASPREMNHLLGCPECDIEADIESMEIVRCERNPQRLYEERVMEGWGIAWALCRFAGTRPLSHSVSWAALEQAMQPYMEALKEQLETPLFGGLSSISKGRVGK